eukprot:751670-Hanusia_phi.AAC.1
MRVGPYSRGKATTCQIPQAGMVPQLQVIDHPNSRLKVPMSVSSKSHKPLEAKVDQDVQYKLVFTQCW